MLICISLFQPLGLSQLKSVTVNLKQRRSEEEQLLRRYINTCFCFSTFDKLISYCSESNSGKTYLSSDKPAHILKK